MNTIIECCCWCYEDAATEIGDRWIEIAFDMAQVAVIKLVSQESHFADGMACLTMMNGGVFTINIPFEEMVEKWRNFKSNILLAYNQ